MDDNKSDIVRAVAENCLERANGDAASASKLLQDEIAKDPTLYRAVMSGYESKACWELIRKEKKNRKEPVWLPPNYDPGQHGERVRYLALANAEMLAEQQRKKQQPTRKRKKKPSPGAASK